MVRSFFWGQGPLVMQISPHHPAIWTRKHHGSGTNPMCLKVSKFVDFDMTNMSQSLKCESGNCTIQCIITPQWHKDSLLSNTTIWDISFKIFCRVPSWPAIFAARWHSYLMKKRILPHESFWKLQDEKRLKWPSESAHLASNIWHKTKPNSASMWLFIIVWWLQNHFLASLCGYKSFSRVRVLNIALYGSIEIDGRGYFSIRCCGNSQESGAFYTHRLGCKSSCVLNDVFNSSNPLEIQHRLLLRVWRRNDSIESFDHKFCRTKRGVPCQQWVSQQKKPSPVQRKENDSGRSVPARLRIWVQRCNFEALPAIVSEDGRFFPR